MKIIALLLSMIVLILTSVPCCALEESPMHQHGQSAWKEANKSTETEEGCCKECSPFYVCGICVGFTISGYSLINFTIHLKSIEHSYGYLNAELAQAASFIWQPPR